MSVEVTIKFTFAAKEFSETLLYSQKKSKCEGRDFSGQFGRLLGVPDEIFYKKTKILSSGNPKLDHIFFENTRLIVSGKSIALKNLKYIRTIDSPIKHISASLNNFIAIHLSIIEFYDYKAFSLNLDLAVFFSNEFLDFVEDGDNVIFWKYERGPPSPSAEILRRSEAAAYAVFVVCLALSKQLLALLFFGPATYPMR